MALEVLQSSGTPDKPEVYIAKRRDLIMDDYRREVVAVAGARVPKIIAGKTLRGMRNANVQDVTKLLKGNWLVYDADEERVVIAYLVVPLEKVEALVAELQAVKFLVGDRNDGTPSRARVAGWLERHFSRPGREGCTLARLHREHPTAGDAVVHFAPVIEEWYGRLNPDLYEEHRALTDKVMAQYRLGGSLFTSAIVNKDNVLPYHFDAGNFQGVWSMMLGLKRDVGEDSEGNAGYLCVPEYDLALAVEDCSISAFDGQVAMHGVTPFAKTSRNAYRYTIVYYSKVGMWQCLPPPDELEYARQARHKKEVNRFTAMPPHYQIPPGGIPRDPPRRMTQGAHWQCPTCHRWCYCPPAARKIPHEACTAVPVA